MRTHKAPAEDAAERLRVAEVLLELGLVRAAEPEATAALRARPDDKEALSLLTKIQHIKGELSLALAGWSELHTRARKIAPTARLRLAALLHLAQQSLAQHALAHPSLAHGSPTLHPRRSLALDVAPVQVVRRPLPYLELEHAFRAWLSRRPDEGRARCRLVALRCRGRDLEMHKLAVLAEAWMAEHAGDLTAACALLEQLGNERAFTADLDRVLTLASLYERVSTRASLEAAAHIYRFLARSLDALPAYAHLAQLYRRLGDEDSALAAEREHAREFRARMRRPSLRQMLQVGARRHLPLVRLHATVLNDALLDSAMLHDAVLADEVLEDDDRSGTMRERGIELALRGDLEEARRCFEALGTPLDEEYLADLRLLASDENELERRGDGEERARYAVGRALAASVYAFPGGAKEGLIHEVWAGKEPVAAGEGGTLADEHIFGNLTPEMHKDVKNTFLAVREYARAKLPQRTSRLMDFRYTYKVTKEDEPSGGASAGLPTALAFLSVFTGEPLPQDTAATGQIVTDAHDVLRVHGVGDVPYKVRAACHRNLRALLAPSMNRAELLRSPLVPRAVSLEMTGFVSTLDEAALSLFGAAFFG